ncbi:uncharacterized protein [Typha latifolia]|uniref:uncharacterized protein n=1 Tax=Typha latifolia TaxID=4733 RepID=UPI003C2FB148
MDVVKQNITHFLHQHPLKSTNGYDYACNGCYLPGKGARYRCDVCDFDLHFLCALCPNEIPFSGGHSNHRSLTVAPSSNNCMKLIPRPERSQGGGSLRRCDKCLEMVEGMFYQLENGNLDLHPVCFVKVAKEAQEGKEMLYQERGIGSGLWKLWQFSMTALDIFSVISTLSAFL